MPITTSLILVFYAFPPAVEQRNVDNSSIEVIHAGKEDFYVMDISFKRNIIAFSSRGKITLFNTKLKKVITEIDIGRQTASALTVSPCGRFLAAGHFYGGVTVYSLKDSRCLFKAERRHEGMLTSLVFFDDAAKLASVCMDNSLKVWDWKKGKCIGEVTHPGGQSVRIRAHSKHLLTSCMDGKLRVWSKDTLAVERVLQAHRVKRCFNLALQQDVLVTVGHDSMIKWWDLGSMKNTRSEKDPNGDMLSFVAISPTGKHICVTGNEYLTIKPMTKNGKETRLARPSSDKHWLNPRFSPDGRRLYFLARGGRLLCVLVPKDKSP